jgi:hypothetical protein
MMMKNVRASQYMRKLLLMLLPGLLFILAFSPVNQIEEQSVWSRCDVSGVNGTVFMDDVYSIALNETPNIWLTGDINRDYPTVVSVLKLKGRTLAWNSTNGFDNSIPERLRYVGWEILLRDNTPVVWSQWWLGIETGNFYIFNTSDMDHYVADYGGSNSWHVLCGGWLVDNPIS